MVTSSNGRPSWGALILWTALIVQFVGLVIWMAQERASREQLETRLILVERTIIPEKEILARLNEIAAMLRQQPSKPPL